MAVITSSFSLFFIILCINIVSSQSIYWWLYKDVDVKNMDIRQLDCKDACTLIELKTACSSDPTCVAFNTLGWLKNSTEGTTPDVCNLYFKKSSPPPVAPSIYFWPIPISVTEGNAIAVINPALTINVKPASTLVSDYAARIAALIFVQGANEPPASATAVLNIIIANPSTPLALGVDESYSLTIPDDGSAATLTSNTAYGAMMGLQTFSQAVRYDFDAQQYIVQSAPLVINDAPKFAWRGILVDTSRHWLSLYHLYRIIDSLGYAKLNTLHWHIVDWQAWPLESKAYPNLWQAAWSKRERYTLKDISAVITYANARGIRVVPEFDTPGHATSMCVGYPELCCSAFCGPNNNYPLSPVLVNGQNVSLDAIYAVLSELAAISPDEFFHLGGDEVDQTCWNNTASVRSWMAAQKPPYTSTDQVYEYFVSQVDAQTLSLNKSPIRWEEVWTHFKTDLDQRTIIHAWLSDGAIIEATSLGYRAIWSVDGLYYLDALSEVWQTFYDVDILAGITNKSAIPYVLGGETEMWGETADGSDVLQTIWPRAAAAAERQWSYDVTTSSKDPFVEERLQAFRCLLLERGIPAAPVTNPIARSAPVGPGSCMGQ